MLCRTDRLLKPDILCETARLSFRLLIDRHSMCDQLRIQLLRGNCKSRVFYDMHRQFL
jgi:hypothetical protein